MLGGYDGGITYHSTVYKATIDGSGNIGVFDTTGQGQIPEPLYNPTSVTSDINGSNYVYVLGRSSNGNYGQANIDTAGIDK
jgi:hypothetical protein